MKDHRPLAVIGLMIGLAAGSIATIPAKVVLAVGRGKRWRSWGHPQNRRGWLGSFAGLVYRL